MGENCTASSGFAIAMGSGSSASGDYSVAIGSGCHATGGEICLRPAGAPAGDNFCFKSDGSVFFGGTEIASTASTPAPPKLHCVMWRAVDSAHISWPPADFPNDSTSVMMTLVGYGGSGGAANQLETGEWFGGGAGGGGGVLRMCVQADTLHSPTLTISQVATQVGNYIARQGSDGHDATITGTSIGSGKAQGGLGGRGKHGRRHRHPIGAERRGRLVGRCRRRRRRILWLRRRRKRRQLLWIERQWRGRAAGCCIFRMVSINKLNEVMFHTII